MSKRAWVVFTVVLCVVVLAVVLLVPADWGKWVWATLSVTTVLGATKFVTDLTRDWMKNRKRKRDNSKPLVLLPNDAYFQFSGIDAGGGWSATTKEKAQSVEYGFRVDFVNPRPDCVVLSEFRLRFTKAGMLLHEQTPTLYTGEVSCAAPVCPPPSPLALQPNRPEVVKYYGGVFARPEVVADCDAIFFVAKTLEGDEVQVKLAVGIRERH
jgi:hypothetical protein